MISISINFTGDWNEQVMRKNSLILCLGFIFAFHSGGKSQPYFPASDPVFTDSRIPRVDIIISPDSLQQIFADVESDHEYPARFIFSSGPVRDTIDHVGFRIRGNTSRYSAKKSFKVSFNTFIPGRKYYGLEKMNLNGEHNDPSMIRSKLCWDILNTLEIPASRASYTELFINGDYFGLYIHVEHVDEEFVQKRFGRQDGNLYKCLWPADLTYISNNPDDYKFLNGERRTYDLKGNQQQEDYSDLARFIYVLNNVYGSNFKCELENVFNVDNYLRILAFDVLTGNWDNYAYLKNNYYLYHDPLSGRFEFIPYDLDNTFGIDWIGKDWSTRDIYNWKNQEEERPLVKRIMEVPEYRDRYSFYLQNMMDEVLDTASLFPEIVSIRNRISSSIKSDPFYPIDYGYTHDDFLNSYNQATGGHVKFGLKPFIIDRTASATSMLEVYDMIPVISRINHNKPRLGETPVITAKILEDGPGLSAEIIYELDGKTYQKLMNDNGVLPDVIAGDQVFSVRLDPLLNQSRILFKIRASSSTREKEWPCRSEILNVFESAYPDLLINEFMPGNFSSKADEYGEYDDWIELYNNDPNPVWLGDKFLTDDLGNPARWALPDSVIAPGDFVLIWADGDNQQGDVHTNFRLSKSGEEIGIFDSDQRDYRLIDFLSFESMPDDLSMGRTTDGGEEWSDFYSPTPGYSNRSVYIPKIQTSDPMRVWPNPVSEGRVYFSSYANARLFEISGRFIRQAEAVNSIDFGDLDPGVYLLQLRNNNAHTTHKILVH